MRPTRKHAKSARQVEEPGSSARPAGAERERERERPPSGFSLPVPLSILVLQCDIIASTAHAQAETRAAEHRHHHPSSLLFVLSSCLLPRSHKHCAHRSKRAYPSAPSEAHFLLAPPTVSACVLWHPSPRLTSLKNTSTLLLPPSLSLARSLALSLSVRVRVRVLCGMGGEQGARTDSLHPSSSSSSLPQPAHRVFVCRWGCAISLRHLHGSLPSVPTPFLLSASNHVDAALQLRAPV